MDLGICVASHVGDIDYVVRAEELGYTHAWLADSQMVWSDCYATLALAATQTNKIIRRVALVRCNSIFILHHCSVSFMAVL